MSAKTELPLVSVVVTTHNRAEMLSRALESVAHQSFRDFELVVVDDASTDQTDVAVETFRESHPELTLRYFRLDAPSGANAARNRGLREAAGTFVTGLDDDDEFLPGRLERLVQAYDDRYAFLCSSYYAAGRRRKLVNPRTETISADGLRVITSVVGGQVFARRDRFLELGGFDEGLPAAQDTDMWLRLVERYGCGFRIGEPLYVAHTAHARRTTTSERKFRGYRRFYFKHRKNMSRAERRYLLYKLVQMRTGRTRLIHYLREVPPNRKWVELKTMVKQYLGGSR